MTEDHVSLDLGQEDLPQTTPAKTDDGFQLPRKTAKPRVTETPSAPAQAPARKGTYPPGFGDDETTLKTPDPTPSSGATGKTTDQVLKDADTVEADFQNTLKEGRAISNSIVPDETPAVLPVPAEHRTAATAPDGVSQLSRYSTTSLRQMLQTNVDNLQETQELIQMTLDDLNRVPSEGADYDRLMQRLHNFKQRLRKYETKQTTLQAELGVSPPATVPDDPHGRDDPIVGRLVEGDGEDDTSAIKDDTSAPENENHVPNELTGPASNGRDTTPDPQRPAPDAGRTSASSRLRHQPRVNSTTGAGGGSHTGGLQGTRGATNEGDNMNTATHTSGGTSHRFSNVTLRPLRFAGRQ
ncbi:hypothetical protein THAOC_12575 [Thalassiosira oceanica]|uniref:Uncharacterized protein n=1 Tax=Thalassiosira oceanica TaxID=159749 RepID=K0SNF0_THAOC|nr:hypothetical protein THAOC_12575 [Thalassiosira oceanica]|eukprot:EJK66504.1 hypothetical protein THAOC_12575 [Thalassiosira oceanica]